MNCSVTALLVLLTFVSPVAAQTRIYVGYACGDMPPCSPFGSVSVIDADTNTITTTIDVHPRGGDNFSVGRGFSATPAGELPYPDAGNALVIMKSSNHMLTSTHSYQP